MPVIPALEKAGVNRSLQVRGHSGLESQNKGWCLCFSHICHRYLFLSFFFFKLILLSSNVLLLPLFLFQTESRSSVVMIDKELVPY